MMLFNNVEHIVFTVASMVAAILYFIIIQIPTAVFILKRKLYQKVFILLFLLVSIIINTDTSNTLFMFIISLFILYDFINKDKEPLMIRPFDDLELNKTTSFSMETLALSLLFATIILLFNFISSDFISSFLSNHGLDVKNQPIVTSITNETNIFNQCINLLQISFVAPIIEEFFIRYILYNCFFKKYFPTIISMLFTSLIFAFLHQNLFAFLGTFFSGLIFNILYEKKGIYSSMLCHSFSNTFVFIFICLNK